MNEERIIFGDRIFAVKCYECDLRIYKTFFKILKKYKTKFIDLMDEYKIPNEVLINFKQGNGDLTGFYYVHNQHISKRVVVMDIYTLPFSKLKNKDIEHELINTFAHEIIHNLIDSEKETLKRTQGFMDLL